MRLYPHPLGLVESPLYRGDSLALGSTWEAVRVSRQDAKLYGFSLDKVIYDLITGNIVAMGVALGVGYIPETPTGAHKFDYAGDF